MKQIDYELRGMFSKDVARIPLASTLDEDNGYSTTTYSNFVDSYNYADGDTADLQKKLNDAITKKTDLVTSLSDAQTKYDEANARYCVKDCGKRKNPPCHSECWSKDRDKRIWSDKISQINKDIPLTDANISSLTTLLNESKQRDLQGQTAQTQNQVDLDLAKQGLTRDSAEILAKKQGSSRTILIVGGLGIVALATVLLLKKD